MKVIKKITFLFLYLLCMHTSLFAAQYVFKPLKILFVTDKFPYEPRQYINNQITGLLDRGHEVYILAEKIGEFLNTAAIINKYSLLQRTYYNDFSEKLKSVDIIYCQFGTLGDYCLDLIEKYKLKAKLVVCFRGDDATQKIQGNSHMYDVLFSKGHFFLPVCENFKEMLISSGCPSDKIMVHHSGIDINAFKYKNRKRVYGGTIQIITSARLVKKKGLEYAIQAIAQVKKIYPHICYKILGDGPEELFLKNLIQELALEKEVFLLGHQSHEMVRQELYQSHIFLLPSLTADNGNQEGIPNSLMEAMATGMPIVSTDHSGISELIENGVSGFLVPEKDSDQLADRLLYLIQNSQCWSSMGMMGRKRIEQEHDREKLNNIIVKTFKLLLSTRSGECNDSKKYVFFKKISNFIRNIIF